MTKLEITKNFLMHGNNLRVLTSTFSFVHFLSNTEQNTRSQDYYPYKTSQIINIRPKCNLYRLILLKNRFNPLNLKLVIFSLIKLSKNYFNPLSLKLVIFSPKNLPKIYFSHLSLKLIIFSPINLLINHFSYLSLKLYILVLQSLND